MSVAHHDRLMLDYTDFAAVRGLIRTRMYSTAPAGVQVVRRVVAPGLIQRIVIDHGGTVTPVSYELLQRWPIGEFELFTLAERNVRAEGGVRIRHGELDIPLADALPPLAILSGPEYLTAHVRWLDEHPVTGPAGAVLIMPSAQHIYAYPVVGAEVAAAVTVLAQLARASYEEEPAPITPWVYWWHDGQLELAATAGHQDGQVQPHPTEQFRRVVERLGGPEGY
ncbi:hypothetical protein [Nocardia blacklockiae]|uniref:hypothetical protein n=1 Tax=Nocardia blacklockiae TaxID=480036 RepID=UPI00189309D3|nr:hypothetical protein [Nocardia blacklockiae]MBF6171843.1 hypothetical protein [Nocardia blacklockiae]